MKTKWFNVALAAMAALLLAGCGAGGMENIRKDPAALKGDLSGKDFSGSYAPIRAAGDIPHAPASNGKQARWSQIEVDQILYLDAYCQSELFKQLPKWAQAIAGEGGWSALATAVGEGAFASAFPGADVARYVLGGLGFGFASGANTGRYRQDGSEKGAMAYCMVLQIWEARNRYQILEGISAVPWYGNGTTTLPKATNSTSDPATPSAKTNGSIPPLPGH